MADRTPVHCPKCRKKVFDGAVILSSVVRVGHSASEAKCKQCKTWVQVPLVYKLPKSA